MRPTRQLHDLGQSLWLDNITRETLRAIPVNARHHSSSGILRLRFNLPQPDVSIIRAAPQPGDMAKVADIWNFQRLVCVC
jgi:hypothetical protein